MAQNKPNARDRRLSALIDIRDKLRAGKHVQNRRLQTWLTEDQFNAIKEGWEDELSQRFDAANKPDAIKEYERRLKRAHFVRNKAEGASQRGKKNAGKLYNAADLAYERVLEYLMEIDEADPSIQFWFDRPLDWSPNSMLGIDFDSMPRVVTSRSLENKSNGLMSGNKQRKSDIKLAVVERAIQDLQNPKPEMTEAETQALEAKLKSMLNKLKSE